MKIDSGTIGMESARSYRARGTVVKQERIRDYRRGRDDLFGSAFTGSLFSEEQETSGRKEGDGKGGRIGEAENSHAMGYETRHSGFRIRRDYGIKTKVTGSDREKQSVQEDLRQITIRYIFELLFATRRNMRNRWLEEHGMTQNADGSLSLAEQSGEQGGTFLATEPMDGVQKHRILQYGSYAEEEYTSFGAVGRVKTSDGREISFQMELCMSRSFEMTFQKELETVKGSMRDPLVINYDAPSAMVKDQKFFFDLDADGRQEEIAELVGGSGYLALDLNEDGRINDGSELFGTRSGDGFHDLAKYDQDGNGWIDENDEVWSKLKIWAKDENGKDILYRLAEKGVGAIYLGSANTDFSLVGRTGWTDAMIRKTGLFLYENGLTGTMQHLDLATYRKQA